MKKICDFFCDFRNLGLLVAAASAAALAFAWTMQYGFNFQPCQLCYMQRKPYMVAVGLGLLAALFSQKAPRAAFVTLVFASLAFMVDMSVAGFHFGTEQGWWPLLEGCGGGQTLPPIDTSIEDLMKIYEERPIVRCDVPGWMFLGLSMTGWNFLYASGLALFTLFHAIMGRRNVDKA